jgi:hypothetical protein
MSTAEEIQQNLFGVQNGIAQQRLEGLTPSHEVINDLERAARGEITVCEVIANIGKRYRDAEIREPRPLP